MLKDKNELTQVVIRLEEKTVENLQKIARRKSHNLDKDINCVDLIQNAIYIAYPEIVQMNNEDCDYNGLVAISVDNNIKQVHAGLQQVPLIKQQMGLKENNVVIHIYKKTQQTEILKNNSMFYVHEGDTYITDAVEHPLGDLVDIVVNKKIQRIRSGLQKISEIKQQLGIQGDYRIISLGSEFKITLNDNQPYLIKQGFVFATEPILE